MINVDINNIWEKSYKEVERLWSSNPDSKLMQYLGIINKGNMLDLGIGEGRNAMPFNMLGFNIDGVDISETALSRCRDNLNDSSSIINLDICDLRKYDIKKDNYSIIVSANVLNFFKKSEVDGIIRNIKDGLNEGGIVYLSVFSTLEPKYTFLKSNKKENEVEENTFYIEERDSYAHFFTQEELLQYFNDFELICVVEGLEYDSSHGNPHYHGGIEFIARKK